MLRNVRSTIEYFEPSSESTVEKPLQALKHYTLLALWAPFSERVTFLKVCAGARIG